MNKPLISIITPSLNRAKFIELNIKSLMSQTYKNFEHIIVDGGSTDGTIDILKRYEKKYNMRWISEPDDGMYAAINKGIKMANGEIVAYLNTDDLYLPWTLEVVAKNFNKSWDIIYGDCLLIDIKNNTSAIYFQPKFDGYDFLCGGLSLAQPSVFIKKLVFEKTGLFDTNIKLLADCEYWVRAYFDNAVFNYIPEVLSVVVWHGDNLIFNRAEAEKDKNYIREKYFYFEKNKFKKLYRKYRGQVISRFMLISFIFSYLYNTGKWENFITNVKLKFPQILKEFLPNRYRLKTKTDFLNYQNKNLIDVINTLKKIELKDFIK